MKLRAFLATCLTTTLLLAGCASQPTQVPEEDRSEYLYLRGSFTWFDAEDDYKVEKVAGQLYKTTVELVADGQAYEFKFADESWSRGRNCGYANKNQDEVVEIGNKVKANCGAKFEFFRFTPKESGKYDFFIDYGQSEQSPSIWISAYQPDLIDKVVDPIKNNMPDL
ncbi:hypothetical protein C2869_08415 [Saccharobesus litoralis]|uniref:Pullulanase n=1 Tax=Saccharobesus litoralis TaxID=2172099 RepID=A0A2S0VQF6_9ALTE|nr:hypothetical protein [Saccharobesus litoralis]AWB66447.1 hypothetical protein C2869_08415 [Saccharobesus litoralis]